ncbi:MAG: serine hydrolase domain-containing protein [candidate division NC10 bacterium]|nr:serine hydrolase domain-containing protein [candidate division NC10 bacterium]
MKSVRLPSSWILTLCLILWVAIPHAQGQGLPTVLPEEVGLSSQRLERIDKLMQDYVDRGQVAGVIALIARHGKVAYSKSFGVMDEGKPMRADAIFRIASMTKPIVSVAAMILLEEGRILLNEPISKYLPEFKNPRVLVSDGPGEGQFHLVPAKREITIRHLLNHTSGISYGFWGRPHLYALYTQAGISDGLVQTESTIAEGVAKIAKMPLMNQPGEAWEYGLNTDVLGRLVEVVSGMPLDQFLAERIFKPLGMVDTHFFLPESKIPRLAAVYTPNERGGLRRLSDEPVQMGYERFSASWHYQGPRTYFSGGAGLVSTAADYLRFLQMLLNGGELNGVRILAPRTVELMSRNQIGGMDIYLRDPGYQFGLGFAVLTDPDRSGRMESRGTYEWGGFFYTRFWVDPQEDLIGILMPQIRPNRHLDLDGKFRVLTYQAIIK